MAASNSDVGYLVVASAILEAARNEWLAKLEKRYRKANEELENGNYAEAARQFGSLGDYSDAKQKAEIAASKERDRIARENEQRKQNEAKYERASDLAGQGKYDQAITAFSELGSFKDSSQRAQELIGNESRYKSACSMLANQNYKGAIQSFSRLGDYKDSARKKADAETQLKRAEYSQQVKDLDSKIKTLEEKRDRLNEQKRQYDRAQNDLNSGTGAPDSDGCLGTILLAVGIWQTFCWIPFTLTILLGNTTYLLFYLICTVCGPGFLGISFYLRSREKQQHEIWSKARETLDEIPSDLLSELDAIEKELKTLKGKKASLKKP